MPVFIYEAKTSSGQIRRGEMEAARAEIVEQRVQNMGLVPLKVRAKPKEILLKIPGTTGVTTRDLVIFTRQLSTMIDAGLPIVQALELLASQEPNPHFKIIQRDIKLSVESGLTFGESLRKHPRIFDSLYCSLVSAGEAGGVLDVILSRLCVQIEKSEKIKKKVKGAMTYPVATLVISILVVIVMLWKVIPTFQDMFSSMGGQLPGITQTVIDMSEWFGENIIIIFLVLIAIPVTFKLLLRRYAFRKAVHNLLLHLPMFGSLIRKTAVSRFTRTMGTMLSSGVPLLDGLNIVAQSAGNLVIEEGILFVRTRISEGATLAEPLQSSGIFPEMVVQMIRVGEETGALDVMMTKIADFYDDEVDATVGNITQMIEPLMMVFIGGIVGGLLISMYLPIFTMGDALKG
ncbi:MAG: type II secretion system F family protein [Bradymonadales bacterium]|jgi:type IV pilus assembly protein PilC